MQSTFFSYSSKDLPHILPYEQALQEAGGSVWRDKTSLKTGDYWPMRLGEAIEQQSLFLLFWSANANDSDFVTLEWNSAIALGKKIIPILLDNTPLPASLHAIHAIQTVQQLKNQIDAIKSIPQKEPDAKLLKQLKKADNKLDKAISIVKKTNQNNWNIGGNVYQVKGDLNIKSSESNDTDRRLHQWAAYATILATVIALIVFAIGIYKDNQPKTRNGDIVIAQLKSAGTVTDATGNLLADVIISIHKYGLKTKTNRQGHFSFTLKNIAAQAVKIHASKTGYQPWNDYITLGDKAFNFSLRQ